MSNSDKKFIYVFSEDDAETMIKSGYEMISKDEKKGLYVFLNRVSTSVVFSKLPDITYCFTDVLTF